MDIKTKWLEALRSGKYKQTTMVLEDSCGNCCLGVLMHVAGKGEMLKQHNDETLRIPDPYWGDGEMIDPLSEEYIPSFIAREIGASFLYDTMVETDMISGNLESHKLMDILIGMNDDQGHDFNEIADYIEKHVK